MHYTPKLTPLNVDNIARKIKAASSILLSTHKQCDGDGLGAMLALFHGLRKIGKEVRVMTVDEVPKKYAYLEPNKYIENYDGVHQPLAATQLALIFDTNDRRLVEPLYSNLEQVCDEVLFVDHHPVLNQGPEPPLGSFIDTRAASTGEISYFIIKTLGIRFDENIAKALYTSIVFDTQLFRFVKNSPTSHLIAAELIEHLPNATDIHRHLFATHSIDKIAFLSKVLAQIEYHGDGRLAVLKLKSDDLNEFSMEMDDSRDVIDMIMNVNSLQAAALFREEGPNTFKLSLRSRGKIEVLGVAESFGGGGHMFAAGALMTGDYTLLKEQVIQLLLGRLDNEPAKSKAK